MDNYQLTLDDWELQHRIGLQSERTAFIDEYGSFGFDFSSPDTSKYYVLCAVIVDDKKIDSLHTVISEVKRQNGFANAELKSSKIGSNYPRRSKILSQLLPIDFRVVLFVANKQEFIKDTSVTVGTFVKNNGGEIVSMLRFAVGEGIEKKQEDFASEVMNQING